MSMLDFDRDGGIYLSPLYDGELDIPNEDIVSVYVIVNGSLKMQPGKIAGQTFHVGWVLHDFFDSRPYPLYSEWVKQGRRVVVRLAETKSVFERVKTDVRGIVERDEGMTEVDHGAETVFVSFPYKRSDIPKVLTHKKVQLL